MEQIPHGKDADDPTVASDAHMPGVMLGHQFVSVRDRAGPIDSNHWSAHHLVYLDHSRRATAVTFRTMSVSVTIPWTMHGIGQLAPIVYK